MKNSIQQRLLGVAVGAMIMALVSTSIGMFLPVAGNIANAASTCEERNIMVQDNTGPGGLTIVDDTAEWHDRQGTVIERLPQIKDRWVILPRDVRVSAGANEYISQLRYHGRGNRHDSKHYFLAYVQDANNNTIQKIEYTDRLEGRQRIDPVITLGPNAQSVFWPAGTYLGQYNILWATFCQNAPVVPTPTPTPTPSQSMNPLTAVKSGPATVTSGGIITYTVAITNPNSVTAQNVEVVDGHVFKNQPTTFVPEASSTGCVVNTNNDKNMPRIHCLVGNLKPQATKSVTIAVRVANSICTSNDPVIKNMADVKASNVAKIWSNEVITKVSCPAPSVSPAPSPTPTPTPTPTPVVPTPTPAPTVVQNEQTDQKQKQQDIHGPAQQGQNQANVEQNAIVNGNNNTVAQSTNIDQRVTNIINNGSPTPKALRANPAVKAAVSKPVAVTNVPVTAKTGAGALGILSTLLGGSGLTFFIRRKF